MSKIVRYEFLGSWPIFWLFCITGVGLPLAFLYFVNSTVRVEDEIDDPELFLEGFRRRK